MLKLAMVTTDSEYQRVIAYMYKKFPREMDLTKLPDGSSNVPIQWRYTAGKNAVNIQNLVTGDYQSIIYDPERDNEPVGFAGSYFTVGHGIVMFIDPSYRRLGLATDLWWAEAQLYRQAFKIRFQMEIQNEYSLVSTQKMFSDPSKCIITSQGRLKNDGTRAQIRCLLDYTDIDVINGWESMPGNLKTIYDSMPWNFMERENVNDLQKIWEAGRLV